MYDTYVSIDLETTGLNPKRDRIIEIGAIRVEQGQIVEEFSTFVDPGRKLEERITELTGIRDEDLADAPQLDEVFPKLLEFMGELPLLGHSILFDYSFPYNSLIIFFYTLKNLITFTPMKEIISPPPSPPALGRQGSRARCADCA